MYSYALVYSPLLVSYPKNILQMPYHPTNNYLPWSKRELKRSASPSINVATKTTSLSPPHPLHPLTLTTTLIQPLPKHRIPPHPRIPYNPTSTSHLLPSSTTTHYSSTPLPPSSIHTRQLQTYPSFSSRLIYHTRLALINHALDV
jgi:hypothetical protein